MSTPPFDLGQTGADLYEATAPIAYADRENAWAWASLMYALSGLLDVVAEMVRDDGAGNPGWTALASPARCPEPWLRVLAQWAGIRRWDAMSADDLRELIGPRAPGLWRGTRAAMIDAARRFLPRPFDAPYRPVVLADNPSGYWRLGESPGATAALDEIGRNPGTYSGSQTPNLVLNPSIETDLSNWVAGGGAALSRSTDRARFGTASAHLTRTPPSGTYSECSMQLPLADRFRVPVLGGGWYTLSAYVYPLSLFSPQQPWVSFVWYDAAGNQISQTTQAGVNVPLNQWTRIIGARQAPDDARFVRYYAGLYSGSIGDDQTVVEGYVDAVQLTQTAAAVNYSDTQGLHLGVPGAVRSEGDTAVVFDGLSGTVDCGLGTGLFDFTGPLSLELWFRAPASKALHNMLVRWGAVPDPPSVGYIFRTGPTGNIELHLTPATGNRIVSTSGRDWCDGRWHHTVATFDGTDGRIYVDGELRATAAMLPPDAVATSLRIGTAVWDGALDEVAVYGYPLSLAQVAAHYEAGMRLQPPDPETTLYFEERADGDPYLLRVFTYTFVDHDPALVEAALQAAKPAGLTLIYEVRQGQNWNMLARRGLSWGEVSEQYASWHDVLTDEPIASAGEEEEAV